eukprot:jgi/Orpsp1_1/1176791/evm.model.c7180000059018.2
MVYLYYERYSDDDDSDTYSLSDFIREHEIIEIMKENKRKIKLFNDILKYIRLPNKEEIIAYNFNILYSKIYHQNEDDLINDYILYYLSKSKFSDLSKNVLTFFDILYKLFKNNYSNLLGEYQHIVAKFSLFIESYKEPLYLLSEYCCSLDSKINDILNSMNLNINSFFESNNSFISLINVRNVNNIDIVYNNDVFISVFELMICCFINNNNDAGSFNTFLNELKEFHQKLNKNSGDLNITLKQTLYFNDFILVIDYLHRNRILSMNKLTKFKEILLKEIIINDISSSFSIASVVSDIINKKFLFLNSIRNSSSSSSSSHSFENLINHISMNWKQIIKGDYIIFDDMYKASNIDFFQLLINMEKEFENSLPNAFKHISYHFKTNLYSINIDSHTNNIYEYVNNNSKLKTMIHYSVTRKIENIKSNLILEMYREGISKDYNFDFISELENYLKSIYNDALTTTIIQFEKFNILTNKFIHRKEPDAEDLDTIYQYYINNFDTSIKRYSNTSTHEKIEVYIGVSYPHIIPLFKKIDQCLHENKNMYLENEDDDGNNVNNNMNGYYNKKSIYENNVVAEFRKQLDNDIIINNQNYTIENIAKFSLFIESYKKYIYFLSEFISSMDSKIIGFSSTYNSLILSNQFRNNKFINNLLFYLFESIVNSILRISNNNDIQHEQFNILIKELKESLQKENDNNSKLTILLRQILSLSEFLNERDTPIQNKLQKYQDIKCIMNEYQNILSGFENNLLGKWGENDIKGGRIYTPPDNGCLGFGLNIFNKFDNGNNSWFYSNDYEGDWKEWCIAYHGFSCNTNLCSNIKDAINGILKTNLKAGKGQAHAGHEDACHQGQKVGRGVYCTPVFKECISYANKGKVVINGHNYKVIFMLRVKPKQIRHSKSSNYWVLNGDEEFTEMRPYKLLFLP